MILPQSKFPDFLAEEAQRYSVFRVVLGATVQRLVQDDGATRVVRYRATDGGWRSPHRCRGRAILKGPQPVRGGPDQGDGRRWMSSGSVCLAGQPIKFGMRNLPLAPVDIIGGWRTILWMILAVWPHHRGVNVA